MQKDCTDKASEGFFSVLIRVHPRLNSSLFPAAMRPDSSAGRAVPRRAGPYGLQSSRGGFVLAA
jgi:hypothetical protein